MKKKHLVCAVAAILAGTGVHALPADEGEDVLLAEFPVVLSASRLAQPLQDAPAAVTIISRDMIEASPARTISDLMRLVPGMVVAWASNERQVVSEHGLSGSISRRMQILLDGRSINLPSFGGPHWSSLPLELDDIERIEVVRGPSAVSYGANAFLGAINIITKHPATEPGWRFRVRQGEEGIADRYASYSFASGPLTLRASVARREDNGTSSDGFMDSHSEDLANFTAEYQLNQEDVLLVDGGINQGTGQRGSSTYTVLPDPEVQNYFLRGRWERRFSASEYFRVQAALSRYSVDRTNTYTFNFTSPKGSETIYIDNKWATRRASLELEGSKQLSDSLRYVAGASYWEDKGVNTQSFDPDKNLSPNYTSVFGNLEWRAQEPLLVNLGLMLEKYTYSDTLLSPRLGLNYTLAPGHTLRASVSKSSRVPTLFEEASSMVYSTDYNGKTYNNITFQSSGGLGAEEVIGHDIGYLGQWFDKRLAVDVRLFQDNLSNLIYAQRVTGPEDNYNGAYYDYQGDGWATLKGFEMQLDFKPLPRHHYRVAYAYTLADSNVMTYTLGSPTSDIPLTASVPRNNITLWGTFPLGSQLYGTAMYQYMSKRTYPVDFDGQLGGDPLPALHRLDLRMAYPFKWSANKGEIAVSAQAVNGSYNEFQLESEFQPRAWLELRLELP